MLSRVNTDANFEAFVFFPKITDIGKRAPKWEVGETSGQVHAHARITSLSGKSSPGTYKWIFIVTQSTVVRYCSKTHQLTEALILLSKRDVRGFKGSRELY